jgi:para-nitrobenzyl esterase
MRSSGLLVVAALGYAVAARAQTAQQSAGGVGPRVRTANGVVAGVVMANGVRIFKGIPFAAPPTRERRWKPPQPVTNWPGVRAADRFAHQCMQARVFSDMVFRNEGMSEDCLYLNVWTPATTSGERLPVLVYFYGGGFIAGDASEPRYDGASMARRGVVVVTTNYRLGVFGFFAHPELTAESPHHASGNYASLDQLAGIEWVKKNIAQFGGDPHRVTIAGQSAGGVAVLAHVVSRRSRGLFQRAIVESGAFALDQEALADAEADGETFAAKRGVGCADQSASCLRHVPFQALVDNFPTFAIPGVVDGAVLREPIGKALAAGHFAHVPILNGINHNEELIFVAGLGLAVSGGTFVPVPEDLSAATYERAVAQVLSVTKERAAAIAAEYPLAAYGSSPVFALSTLVADANFACPALQVDRWTSRRMPTFAYQFNDDSAPPLFAGPGFPPIATHSSEIQYLLDQPNAPFAAPLDPTQETLAATMRAAWANFAASGDPTSAAAAWPAFTSGSDVLSLRSPQPQIETDFAASHHCSFWAG